ncbi:hypothetical protein [Vibrio tapetis]|uniref:Uncharacterized protein n=1 Tax=Vibrio tapetis subsp. tapetis TaxID=1671868 RepID=A0A2N8ZIM8_9VIBR|nr:hypothetical protein [Vibrio tapetis]SON51764.1 protein of unknown function [Vibrio tapetis subsp. tapetis]
MNNGPAYRVSKTSDFDEILSEVIGLIGNKQVAEASSDISNVRESLAKDSLLMSKYKPSYSRWLNDAQTEYGQNRAAFGNNDRYLSANNEVVEQYKNIGIESTLENGITSDFYYSSKNKSIKLEVTSIRDTSVGSYGELNDIILTSYDYERDGIKLTLFSRFTDDGVSRKENIEIYNDNDRLLESFDRELSLSQCSLSEIGWTRSQIENNLIEPDFISQVKNSQSSGVNINDLYRPSSLYFQSRGELRKYSIEDSSRLFGGPTSLQGIEASRNQQISRIGYLYGVETPSSSMIHDYAGGKLAPSQKKYSYTTGRQTTTSPTNYHSIFSSRAEKVGLNGLFQNTYINNKSSSLTSSFSSNYSSSGRLSISAIVSGAGVYKVNLPTTPIPSDKLIFGVECKGTIRAEMDVPKRKFIAAAFDGDCNASVGYRIEPIDGYSVGAAVEYSAKQGKLGVEHKVEVGTYVEAFGATAKTSVVVYESRPEKDVSKSNESSSASKDTDETDKKSDGDDSDDNTASTGSASKEKEKEKEKDDNDAKDSIAELERKKRLLEDGRATEDSGLDCNGNSINDQESEKINNDPIDNEPLSCGNDGGLSKEELEKLIAMFKEFNTNIEDSDFSGGQDPCGNSPGYGVTLPNKGKVDTDKINTSSGGERPHCGTEPIILNPHISAVSSSANNLVHSMVAFDSDSKGFGSNSLDSKVGVVRSFIELSVDRI